MIATDAARIAVDPHLAFVIDDDAELRQSIELTLAQLGMRVATFQMAKEALASLDGGHPAVIFLDVALLRSDAIDVLRGLGERRYGGTVQLMSGGRQSLLEAIQRIGVRHGVKLASPINKPFPRDAIVQVVDSLRAPAPLAPADHEAIPPPRAVGR
jgi:DNA-binding NtrC family response regulator